MNPYYFFIDGFVIAIAWFRMELLIRIESFRIISGVSTALFCTGVFLHFTETGQESAYGALLNPALVARLIPARSQNFPQTFQA